LPVAIKNITLILLNLKYSTVLSCVGFRVSNKITSCIITDILRIWIQKTATATILKSIGYRLGVRIKNQIFLFIQITHRVRLHSLKIAPG